MGQINRTFIYLGKPTNGAIAKLWEKAGFGSPPAYDDAEPDVGYQVGSEITTGVQYGGDGAYRWTGIDDGEYYVSCYYDNHRVWLYVATEIIADILTTQGDLLVRGASVPERLAKGADGKVLKMVSGAPAWATVTITLTLLGGADDTPVVTGSWVDIVSVTVGAMVKKVILCVSGQTGAVLSGRGLYNSVEKFNLIIAQDSGSHGWLGKWHGDGLAIEANAKVQASTTSGGTDYAAGAIYGVGL